MEDGTDDSYIHSASVTKRLEAWNHIECKGYKNLLTREDEGTEDKTLGVYGTDVV